MVKILVRDDISIAPAIDFLLILSFGVTSAINSADGITDIIIIKRAINSGGLNINTSNDAVKGNTKHFSTVTLIGSSQSFGFAFGRFVTIIPPIKSVESGPVRDPIDSSGLRTHSGTKTDHPVKTRIQLITVAEIGGLNASLSLNPTPE